jgi:hypothetical protein
MPVEPPVSFGCHGEIFANDIEAARRVAFLLKLGGIELPAEEEENQVDKVEGS